MNNKVVISIVIGVILYAVFAAAVISFYPDNPQNMDWKDREEYNRVLIPKLELGTSKKVILEQMGSPDITEAKRVQGNELQVMFYRTHHKKADGFTTQDECTALLFINNRLSEMGDGAYQSYLAQ